LCTKYLGDSKFAYLFSTIYLMKEQAGVIVTNNFEKYRPELDDFTLTKQKILFDCFQEMSNNGIIAESMLDRETNTLKIYKKLEPILQKYLIEDEVVGGVTGTTVSDIAQFTPRIGEGSRKKIQRRLLYGRNRKKRTN
jgi:hypothetical protein